MTVLMAECSGLWRRTLLIDSDGSRDKSTNVAWLQGITAYVDTRGLPADSVSTMTSSSGSVSSTSSRRARFPTRGECVGRRTR